MQHLQDVTNELREAQKEADRDLMDSRTERFQNLMTVSSLLLAGCFTLAVEGVLPEDPGQMPVFDMNVVEVYYTLLAAALGLNWITILCSLRITDRISRYMAKIQESQQDILKGKLGWR